MRSVIVFSETKSDLIITIHNRLLLIVVVSPKDVDEEELNNLEILTRQLRGKVYGLPFVVDSALTIYAHIASVCLIYIVI